MRADAIELSTIARATTTNSNFIIILISLKIICSKEKPLLKEDGHNITIYAGSPAVPALFPARDLWLCAPQLLAVCLFVALCPLFSCRLLKKSWPTP